MTEITRQNGFVAATRVLMQRLSRRQLYTRWQKWGDRRRGLDFIQSVEVEELGLDPARSIRYAPTSALYLRSLLKPLQIRPEDRILDVGAGKGAAIRTMLEFPFAAIDGLEISPALKAIAEQNFSILGVMSTRVRMYSGDAASFQDLDSYNYVYLYNPFPSAVMALFVANLVRSFMREPRCLRVIYNHGTLDVAAESNGLFRETKTIGDEWGGRTIVYEAKV